jgi:hypothetical protein
MFIPVDPIIDTDLKTIFILSCRISYRILCIVPCRVVSYRIVSYRVVSCRIVSYRVVSYRIVSYRIVSFHIVLYRIVSYRIVSYRIVSYRIVSYRIVSYRIVSLFRWTCHVYSTVTFVTSPTKPLQLSVPVQYQQPYSR